MKSSRLISGVNPAFLGYLFAKVPGFKGIYDKVFAIFPEEDQGRDFIISFRLFSNEKAEFVPVPVLPVFSDAITYDESEKDKLRILWELPFLKALAFTPRTFLRKTHSRATLKEEYLYVIPGEKVNREAFVMDLIRLGYERVGQVEERGEFSVKGAVIDLFSPQYLYPARIEFFGDEVTAIKFFDISTQRSIERAEELSVLPAKELFFPKDSKRVYSKLLSLKHKVSERRISELIRAIENQSVHENPEYLLPLFFSNLILFPENVSPEERIFLVFERSKLEKEIENLWEKIGGLAHRAKEREKLLYDETLLYTTKDEFEELLKSSHTVLATELPISGKESELYNVEYIDPESLLDSRVSKIDRAFQFLIEHLHDGYQIYFVTSDERTERVVSEGLLLRGVDSREGITFERGILRRGFVWHKEKIILTSEWDLFGKRGFSRETTSTSKSSRAFFRRYEDLKPGDLVVHKRHGIGRFLGLVSLKLDGFEGEFLQLEYADGDKLYLPVSRLEELYPYVGLDEKEPPLDKLGKKSFLLRRKEVERHLTEVVEEILRLYAERRAVQSYAIPFPALAYSEFVQTFPFEETPDQISAIEEILADLTSPKAMDRLLVGDVGFGKTEVALRAIFVTAYSGKQVAVLTPTTLLAEQHYRNFKERLEPFNIKVGVVSRLRSQKELKETLKALEEGELKVIIGTHRLLSSDVKFKDLGLLVIDEEHRFGVRQKEKLKQLKKSVKVLSLSATPIPRSLQLSLLGIFDLSLLETPPPGRQSIKTILSPFDPELIGTGIEEELQRGGQIYFVHPRIQGLNSLATFLKKLVPKARTAVLHGQMDENQIERTLYSFLKREIDILVCTPIIGSGIDIPTANTIFINRADMFGLADIYQLRGRVGRSQERGYCYLLVPDLKSITEGAQKRLKALMQFVELGSCFKLSLSDLKIRGAGELLGINQSGHINKVGYELYLELLENTIKSLKGEAVEDWEPEVNLKVPAYFPPSFVPEPGERLGLYRELVLTRTFEELEDFEQFLQDKYGPLPKEAQNLLKIYKLKLCMKKLKVLAIEEKGKNLLLILGEVSRLPAYRKVSKGRDYQLIRVQEEKGRARLIFKGDKPSIDTALEILLSVMNLP